MFRLTRDTRRGIAAAALATLLSTSAIADQGSGPNEVSALLQRRTQELLDTIAAGDRGPWTRYLHEAIVYTAEDGSTKSKAQLLDELRPFPKEVWGTLRVTRFRTRLHGTTAIASYVAEEEEGYFGQRLHARYAATDTWIETADRWRLAASQVVALRDDPPSVQLPASRLDAYVGVYALTPDVSYTIRREGDGLVGQRTGRKPEALKAELLDCFFVPGEPRLRKVFQRDATGRVTAFVERRESW
jgi:hypothetical protein